MLLVVIVLQVHRPPDTQTFFFFFFQVRNISVVSKEEKVVAMFLINQKISKLTGIAI